MRVVFEMSLLWTKPLVKKEKSPLQMKMVESDVFLPERIYARKTPWFTVSV